MHRKTWRHQHGTVYLECQRNVRKKFDFRFFWKQRQMLTILVDVALWLLLGDILCVFDALDDLRRWQLCVFHLLLGLVERGRFVLLKKIKEKCFIFDIKFVKWQWKLSNSYKLLPVPACSPSQLHRSRQLRPLWLLSLPSSSAAPQSAPLHRPHRTGRSDWRYQFHNSSPSLRWNVNQMVLWRFDRLLFVVFGWFWIFSPGCRSAGGAFT